MLLQSVERRRQYASGEAVGEDDPEADDAVFMSSHIPQALAELEDPEYESRRYYLNAPLLSKSLSFSHCV